MGTDDAGFPPGHDRAELVFELGRFLAEWSQILRAPGAQPRARIVELHRVSMELQARSRASGFGGVAHHLAQCSALLNDAANLDSATGAKLKEAFGNVSELVWQARQELTAAEQAMVDRSLAARPGRDASPLPPPISAQSPPVISAAAPPAISAAMPPAISAAMPPVISAARPPVGAQNAAGLASPIGDLAPPPVLSARPRGAAGPADAGPPPRLAPGGENAATLHSQGHRAVGTMGPAVQPQAPPIMRADATASPNPEVIAVVYPKEAHGSRAPSFPVPEPQATLSSTPDAGPPRPAVSPPGQMSVPQPAKLEPSAGLPGLPGPKLLVRSMLGLRAFDRKQGDGDPPPLAPPVKDAKNESPLLGLRPMSSLPPPPAVEPPPPLMSARPQNVLRPPSRPPRDKLISEPPVDYPPMGQENPAPRSVSARPARGPNRRAPRNTRSPWWLGALAALAVLGAAVGLVLIVTRLGKRSGENHTPTGSASASASAMPSKSSGPAMALPESRLLNEDERFRALVAQMHGHGGKESPELRALVDEQATVQAKLVAQRRCDADPSTCEAWAKARRLLVDPNLQIPAKRRPLSSPDELRSKWLSGLKMPDIPVADDPRVQRLFEYFTENQVGRERLQSMLFRCGAYRDLIQATLIRYDVPTSLYAVVFTESACEAVAKSPVGARGLWQFMPDAGRAYHLRIIKDSLDERLSPPKETEAAIRFLSDLYRKFGAWDLAFASYNMGPFGLLARLSRVEPGGGFWDLADADVLPDETANYVPSIEAFALILANLQKLKFAGSQLKAPEVTSDLDVPPGTRLGLVARASSTSVVELRTLNLDIIGDRVPSVPGERFSIQVPKDVVWQARETLAGLISQGNNDDECVPENFDWGKRRFTPEMANECRERLATPR